MKAIRKKIFAFIAFIVFTVSYSLCSFSVYAEEDVIGEAKITADSLNVRSGPGKDYDAMGKVYEGNTVEVLDVVDEEWLKIKYHSSEGYIALEYTEYEPYEIEEEIEESVDDVQEIIEENETEDEPVLNYKMIFGLIGAIIVILIIILVTVKSLKNMDDYDYEDDDEDEEYEEEEYDDYDEEEEYEDEEEEDEYEYVMVRRPKQKPGSGQNRPQASRQQAQRPSKSSGIPQESQTSEKRMDDYTIDIDPSFFD